MVFNLPELSLDLCPPSTKSSSFPDFSIEFTDDFSKLDDFIYGLEYELKKIVAFKRELPFSFNLLNDVIAKLKEKVKKWEESGRVNLGIDVVGKKDWMSSAQLWCSRNEEGESRRKAEGGAVMLFEEDEKATGLSLVTPAVDGAGCTVVRPVKVSSSLVDQTENLQVRSACHTTGRKQRRVWSPELHRRFVEALEKLGGSKVATPKQIRDEMRVDGLTNDEVKSHLQKYRLHIRKIPAASSTKTLSSVDQGMGEIKPELGYSNSDIHHHSRSPESPLDFDESMKCNSYSMVEDDEKSDGHSWKAQQHM